MKTEKEVRALREHIKHNREHRKPCSKHPFECLECFLDRIGGNVSSRILSWVLGELPEFDYVAEKLAKDFHEAKEGKKKKRKRK